MIIQSLTELYKRLSDNSDIDIPQYGYSKEKVSFSLVFSKQGEFLQLKDIRDVDEKGKPRPRVMTVPKLKGRSGKNPPPYFMWDNSKYILGLEKFEDKKDKNVFYRTTLDRLEAFKNYHLTFKESFIEAGNESFINFLENFTPEVVINNVSNLKEILEDTGNIVFELDEEPNSFLHQNSKIKNIWLKLIKISDPNNKEGICLISGQKEQIARTHPLIKGVEGGQAAGAAISTFNSKSFESYNKEQNFNSPISVDKAFSYTTTLNFLLDRNNHRKIKVADTSVVYWAGKPSKMETLFGQLLDANDDGSDIEIESFLNSISDGKLPKDFDSGSEFFILGLAPNAARISIRFWFVSDVSELSKNFFAHYNDIHIYSSKKVSFKSLSIFQLLLETATLRDSKNIPPLLGGALFKSIITGLPYPESMLSRLLNRIRADGEIRTVRAGMLKAILNRKKRFQTKKYKELSMSLDEENLDKGYLLGRLFAILEKVQKDAIGEKVNATIKDKYFSTASAKPNIVFPFLIRGAQNHLSKIKKSEYPGSAVLSEKKIQSILQHLEKFPTYLNLDSQGCFAIGYYHQNQDIYTKKGETNE